MAGSQAGAQKAAAKRIGMPHKDYLANLKAGLKYCTGCKKWLNRSCFYKNRARGDGLDSHCSDCRSTMGGCNKRSFKGRYQGRPGTRERRKKHKDGLYWCRRCENWKQENQMNSRKGICLIHAREERNEYYQRSQKRRIAARAASRKRSLLTKPVPIAERRRLLEIFKGKCAYCEAHDFEEWDHFIPLAHGGKGVAGNILPSCKKCNRSKHAENPFNWASKQGLSFSERVLLVINTLPEDVTYTHKINLNRGGELNPTATLTNDQAKEIREKFATRKYNYSRLAIEYRVGRWTIGRVIRGETYNG